MLLAFHFSPQLNRVIVSGATPAVVVLRWHNRSEQSIEVVFDDMAGRALSRLQLTYGDAGTLVEESEVLFQEMCAGMAPTELEAIRVVAQIPIW